MSLDMVSCPQGELIDLGHAGIDLDAVGRMANHNFSERPPYQERRVNLFCVFVPFLGSVGIVVQGDLCFAKARVPPGRSFVCVAVLAGRGRL